VTRPITRDPDTKLLLRRVLLVPTAFEPLNTQVDYSDWRDVNGVKVPFTSVQTRPNAILTQALHEDRVQRSGGRKSIHKAG
jgi:hypothetical protein